jgi:orotidine-5'-phosphate decarboxylase
MSTPRAELIVAIDVPDADAARSAIDSLPDDVRFVKIGLELFVREGPGVLGLARDAGKQCFLDLKLHDIPRTVANAVHSAGAHHVFMLTVHAQGGEAMLRAAAEAAAALGDARPRIVAVTTLTSLDQRDLTAMGVMRPLRKHTLALGRLALDCGCDGLVCSPHETAALRDALGAEPLLVTPGVRLRAASVATARQVRPVAVQDDDQKRVATPADAVRAGANFLVVGRPILGAPDPAAAARAILEDMRQAAR